MQFPNMLFACIISQHITVSSFVCTLNAFIVQVIIITVIKCYDIAIKNGINLSREMKLGNFMCCGKEFYAKKKTIFSYVSVFLL